MERRLSIWRFGLALGFAFAIIQSIIVFVIYLFGPEIIQNGIDSLHGFFGGILKKMLDEHIKTIEVLGFHVELVTIVINFCFGVVLGSLMAVIYNIMRKLTRRS